MNIGAIGAWNGDELEGEEETRAAEPHASILSQVIAGERVRVRERAVFSPFAEEEPESAAELDAHGLAALPVSPAVARAHEAQVAEMERRKGDEGALKEGFDLDLRFDPQRGVFEAVAERRVMDALIGMGGEMRIRATF